MRKAFVTALFIFAWLAIVAVLLLAEAKLKDPPFVKGDVVSLDRYLQGRFNTAHENKDLGCGGYAIIDHGKIVAERGFGIANHLTQAKVNTDSTLFLLSSLSKAVTAWGIMKLVADQKIPGIDHPVAPYLKRWTLSPDSLGALITVRHLLSHTAGFVDGYGQGGVESKHAVQSIEKSLTHPNDANSGEGHPAVVFNRPGTRMSYSTAAYGVLQLLSEEVTEQEFHVFMRDHVLLPLGMTQSAFRLQDIEIDNRTKYLASQYDTDLAAHAHRYYSNLAGVSLRSSIHDLALFAAAYAETNKVIPDSLKKEFHAPQPGTSGSWGLGHTLYVLTNDSTYIFGHGGGSFPASGADMRVNPATGNAIVLVATGSQNFISPLADEWILWETGISVFDVRDLIRRRGAFAAVLFLFGTMMILIWRRRWRHSGGK